MGLEQVLNATSVAVVGASKKETKRGYQSIKTLLAQGFEGRIYPVNPKENANRPAAPGKPPTRNLKTDLKNPSNSAWVRVNSAAYGMLVYLVDG